MARTTTDLGLTEPAPGAPALSEPGGAPGPLRRLKARLDCLLAGRPLPADASGITGHRYVWLLAALLWAVLCASEGINRAFQGPYVVQDDARTFLFWMERFFDPGLFPNDIMASYFTAVSPPGYTTVHWIAAVVFGIDPFLLNKFLPLILGLITTIYIYLVCLELVRVPAVGFAAAAILTESVWRGDALPSGTPRAFIYPILAAFMYYTLRRQYLPVLCTVGLLAIFYPQMVAIALGTMALGLVEWRGWRPTPSRNVRAYVWFAGTAALAGMSVLLALARSAEFGPVVTADEARRMLEFTYLGRSYFFTTNWWLFWIGGERSGIFPFDMGPALLWTSFLLPFVLLLPGRFSLAASVSPGVALLTRMAVVSIGMFFAAHLLLFRLHLPSRYTQHSLRLVMSVAAAIVLFLILNEVLARLGSFKRLGRKWVATSRLIVVMLAIVGTVSYPVFLWSVGRPFPRTQYVMGRDLELYKFLESKPKNIVVGSVALESDSIPAFAHRSIYTSYEYGIPYHLGYYSVIRQRAHDLVRAQYTPNASVLKDFIQQSGITYWLLAREAFIPDYLVKNKWVVEVEPEGRSAIASLEEGRVPALVLYVDRCAVFTDTRLVLLDAACVAKAIGD